MADYYGTVAGADAYHLKRGNIVWAGLDEAEKLAALLRTSEWLDGNYSELFPGWKTGYRTQVREWPRAYAYDRALQAIGDQEIPSEIERATYEAALREAAQPGALAVDFVAADVIKQASVEGAVSVTFGGSSSAADAQLNMPAVDAILAPILTGGGNASALSGSRYRT